MRWPWQRRKVQPPTWREHIEAAARYMQGVAYDRTGRTVEFPDEWKAKVLASVEEADILGGRERAIDCLVEWFRRHEREHGYDRPAGAEDVGG